MGTDGGCAVLKSKLKHQTSNIAATAEGEKLDAIRAALPAEGLFADRDWVISPDPFSISEKFVGELEQLGDRLFVFQRACNQLYQLSFWATPAGRIGSSRHAGS